MEPEMDSLHCRQRVAQRAAPKASEVWIGMGEIPLTFP
jgi:hypothetical protein